MAVEDDDLQARAQAELGRWLGMYEWDHFGTLTFSDTMSMEAVVRKFRQWLRRIEQRCQRGVGWFYVIEFDAGGFPHLHVLTAGTAKIGSAALRSAWPNGHSHAVTYHPSGQAARYVTKQVGRPGVEYDFSMPKGQ